MSMRYDLNPPAENVIETFEKACRDLGLKVHQGSLAKYPECIHWHLTISRQKGTLEGTWWSTNHTLWIEIRPNRKADWMEPVVKALVEKF
ncbi:MAG: hypothetical protein H7Y17_05850 [Chlorobia bacterium]|nr:hypothetical protein [Fimbriimonadaceae bacterium]